jgi:membrane-associated phospholipid phosphatase
VSLVAVRLLPLIVLALALNGRMPAQPAQGLGEDVKVRDTPKRFLKDQAALWTSPLRKKSYDSHAVKKYLIPFAIITGALIATDRKTGSALPNTSDQALWSGRFSQLGAAYSLAGISGATFLAGQFTGNGHARETGWLALEALGHTQVAVFVIKEASNRARPLDGDQNGGFWKGGNSFPSGHAASAFAVATVFAYEYREHIAVPIVSYSLASAIAVSRIGARRHWLSDIFAGGSMGFMIGRNVYRRHHNSALPGSKVSLGKRLTPAVGFSPMGPALSWSF